MCHGHLEHRGWRDVTGILLALVDQVRVHPREGGQVPVILQVVCLGDADQDLGVEDLDPEQPGFKVWVNHQWLAQLKNFHKETHPQNVQIGRRVKKLAQVVSFVEKLGILNRNVPNKSMSFLGGASPT